VARSNGLRETRQHPKAAFEAGGGDDDVLVVDTTRITYMYHETTRRNSTQPKNTQNEAARSGGLGLVAVSDKPATSRHSGDGKASAPGKVPLGDATHFASRPAIQSTIMERSTPATVATDGAVAAAWTVEWWERTVGGATAEGSRKLRHGGRRAADSQRPGCLWDEAHESSPLFTDDGLWRRAGGLCG
jgi:hypothetical protein